MKLKEKQMSAEVNRALSSGFQINTQGDAAFLEGQNYNWADLNKLKEDLGTSILTFVMQVNEIITNTELVSLLGDKRASFERTINVFFSDVNNFSNKVKELRVQHEHLVGPITDLNQFNMYNRIAITYDAMYTELTTLVTPSLSEIMLIVSDVVTPNTAVATAPAEQVQ